MRARRPAGRPCIWCVTRAQGRVFVIARPQDIRLAAKRYLADLERERKEPGRMMPVAKYKPGTGGGKGPGDWLLGPRDCCGGR